MGTIAVCPCSFLESPGEADFAGPSPRDIFEREALAWVTGWIIVILACCVTSFPAQAAVTASQLEQVGSVPRPNAQLPLQIRMSDLSDRSAPLQSWLGGIPTLWILADYTCETLCGPAISIVSNTLADTGLKAGRTFG